MEIMLLTIIGAGIMALAVCLYMLARNEWVYRLRVKALETNVATYLAMPTYDQMMYRYWWVWSAEYFYES